MIERDEAQSVFLVPTHAQMLRDLGDDVIASADLSSLDTLYFNAAALPVTLKEWVMDDVPARRRPRAVRLDRGRHHHEPAPGGRGRASPARSARLVHSREIRIVDDDGDPVAARRARRAVQPLAVPDERLPQGRRGHRRLHHRRRLPHLRRHRHRRRGGLHPDRRPQEGHDHLRRHQRLPARRRGGAVTHPAVAEAAVIGVARREVGRDGRRVRRDRAAATSRRRSRRSTPTCARVLPAYKIPRQVIAIDALPRNAGGKVLKRDLRESFATPGSQPGLASTSQV